VEGGKQKKERKKECAQVNGKLLPQKKGRGKGTQNSKDPIKGQNLAAKGLKYGYNANGKREEGERKKSDDRLADRKEDILRTSPARTWRVSHSPLKREKEVIGLGTAVMQNGLRSHLSVVSPGGNRGGKSSAG